MQTQWLSLSPSICLSLSLCRSCHGFMHMKFSQSRDGKFILGENSPPFDSIPEVIHYYTTNKLPIRGAEHLSLLFPVLVQTLWDHTHTHTLITHSHTDTLRASLRRLLQCFIFNHISQALRVFVFGVGIRFFRRVIRFIPGVNENTVGLYWHCIDVLHACEEYFPHHWTLKCLLITLGTAILLLSLLQTLQMIDLTFEDKM